MLKGIITRDGRELSWQDYILDKDVSLYPKPVRQAMYNQLSPARNRWISPSSLMYCLRKAKWELEQDFYLKEKNAYYFVRGSLIHEILANSAEPGVNSMVEQEISCPVPGINFTIGGRLDYWAEGVLYDYKTMGDNGIHVLARDGVKEEHAWQANVYRWILKHGLKIETKQIKIIYIMMTDIVQSGQRFFVSDRKGGEKLCHLPACPVYNDDKVEKFIVSKIKLIIEGYEPPASPQPWLCKGCYFQKKCHGFVGKGEASIEVPSTIKKDIGDLF